MDLKTKVLITGTGGCGVGEGLCKSVMQLDLFDIFTCNSSENSLFVFDNENNSFLVPYAAKENYCEVILAICLNNGIKIIVPGSEQELVVLVKNRIFFENHSIIIFANTESIINTFDNKWDTFIKLKSLSINTPDTTLDINDKSFFERNSYPLVLKPIFGNASKNVFIINSYIELECITTYLNHKKIDFVIQEHIGSSNEEFTISVLSDFNGEYLGSIVLKRVLAAGFSQFVECEEYNELDIIAQNIASKIGSCGPLNIQCRIKNNELYVFEINPRFSGTSPFRAMLGFNELEILHKKTFENINIFKKNNIKFGYFGVRGFQEKIYSINSKFKLKSYE
jgi:carbamoyl-phosphate synthase large subunit